MPGSVTRPVAVGAHPAIDWKIGQELLSFYNPDISCMPYMPTLSYIGVFLEVNVGIYLIHGVYG